jgi:hypothetical protein
MGIITIAPRHLRFAIKLACAVVLALFVGFHFQLETPRWAVLTAAIVAAGPAFAAGGEPYSGAIRYRGMLRIRDVYRLYCGAGDHHPDDPCAAADDAGMLSVGRVLHLALVAGSVENSYAWGWPAILR